jgi:glucosamine-phosphate N-acetyltransferase
MNTYEYTSLLEIIQNNTLNINNIEEIKNQYIKLLSLLTNVQQMSNEDFINKINEISKIGTIIICYTYNLKENKIIIIGTGTIIYEPKIIHGCKYVGHIEDIVIDNIYRSNGIAKNILNKLIDTAKTKNCYKVILDCSNDVLNFYEKIGFELHGNQMSKYF